MPTKIEKDAVTGTETTGHEWDGLKELNTPLPKWWLYILYASIAFSVVWMILFPAWPSLSSHTPGVLGWTRREAIREEMAVAARAQAPMLARITAASLADIRRDPELLAFSMAGGRIAFATNCASCHGAGGQGAPGGFPSLVDDDWIWGGTLDHIAATIRHGVRNTTDPKAHAGVMPAFAGQMTPAQMSDLAEYVLSFGNRSTDPAAAQRGAPLWTQHACVACHGDRGEGNRLVGGPRLNDNIWLYGGSKAAIVAQIAQPQHGVMPAWEGRLDEATLRMLTVYVHTLGGGEN